MTDIPTASVQRFHASDSGGLRHTSIHGRVSNRSTSGHRSNSDGDDGDGNGDHPQQQQDKPTTLALQKAPLPAGSEVPMVAVQVVDRLRWWRTRRVREQPIPTHHYVFRGNYTNYSSFCTRPMAPGLTRLLQQARNVRAQYQRKQKHLQRQQRAQRGTSLTSSAIDAGESRLSQQEQLQQQQTPALPQERPSVDSEPEPLTREESGLLDNKRVVGTPAASAAAAASSRSAVATALSTPAAASAALHASPPLSSECLADGISGSAAAAAAGSFVSTSMTAVAPLSVAAIGSSVCSTSLLSFSGPSEHEAQEAERLLRLYRPRAVSVPVQSRRQRRAVGYGGDRAAAAPQPSGVGAGSVSSGGGAAGAAGDRATQFMHLTRVPTSDDMTEVCQAAGAADCAVVLHHEPRLVIYERALNPRTALRTARVSTDGLEGLQDAAAESSAGVFALTNLPLSGFERFFYQQQLRECRGDQCARMVGSDTAGRHDGDAVGEGAPHVGSAFPDTPLLRTGRSSSGENEDGVALAPGYGVVGRGEALCYGSPLAVSNPLFTSPSRSLAQHVTSPAAVAVADTAARGIAERRHQLSSQNTRKGLRRCQQRSSLRAVSVPCLPRVYKSGCPSLSLPAAAAGSSSPQPSSAATVKEAQGRSSEGVHGEQRHKHSLLPAALLSGEQPRDGAHQCHRVDDLQDAYAFNPIFDVIGKGAFSKVYAAVPMLRGRAGMKRFCTLDAGGVVSDGTATTVAAGITTAVSSVTPTCAPNHCEPRPELRGAARGSIGAASTPPPPPFSLQQQRRGVVRSVPVVALKVIPRKARRKSQKPTTAVKSPTSPPQAAAAAASAADHADTNTSVRRELVEIEREVSILRRLHHTGCSHFYEALRSPDAFVIAMRIYPGSMDARHYLSRYGLPSEARTALILFQLVSTVHYLHTHFGLIHRDIKLENLLFSEADAAVPNTRIAEVLGRNVHKANALSDGGEDNREAEALRTSAAANTYEVMRLLRVTLIDFGLARRTRTIGVPASASRVRSYAGNGSTARNHSLNASVNSPSLAVGISSGGGSSRAATSSNFAASAGAANSSVTNAYVQHSPVPVAAALTPTSASLAQQPVSATSPAHAATSRPSGSTHLTMPAMPPPLFRPSCNRSPSAAAAAAVHANANATTAGPAVSTTRAGMPSPLPSTANMFTRFLDLDEDLDEEDSIANGASATAFLGTTRATSEMIGKNGCGEGSITSPHTGSSYRRPGSRTTFPEVLEEEVESAAPSTDVSASETESDSGREEDTTERSSTASERGSDGASMVRLVSDEASTPQALATAAAAAVPHPLVASPHTPTHLSSEGSVQPVASGSTTSAFSTPPTLSQRLTQPPAPPPQQQQQQQQQQQVPVHLRDDTEATLLLTPCGTEKYLPPEVLSWILERGWTRRSTTVGLARAMDLYAIGIVAYVLLSGCFPFNASSRATLLQQQQRVPRCNSARWAGVSSEAITFVQRLLEPNPLKRMTAKEALEHPLLQEAQQLAAKLSLIPHEEGEEAHGSGDSVAPRQGSAAVGPGSSSSGGGTATAGGHAAVGANSLRAHWSSSSAPGNCCHGSSHIASPVKSSGQSGFTLPGKSVVMKAAATAPDVPIDAGTTTAIVSCSGGGVGAAAAQWRSSVEGPAMSPSSQPAAAHDVFAAISREVVSGERLPLSPPPPPPPAHPHTRDDTSSSALHSPAPRAPEGRATRWEVSPLCPAPPYAKSRPLPAAAAAAPVSAGTASAKSTPPLPLSSPKPSNLTNTSGGGGGDDLFESLYNNIMFSD